MRMRVAIDTNGLFTTQAGVARYIRGLLRGLRRIRPPGLEWDEVAWEVENFGYRQPGRWLKTVYREWIWGKWIAAGRMQRRGVDVFHSTGSYFVRPPRSVPDLATLHDVAVIRHPERFRRWHRWSETRRLERLRKARRIVCVSRFSADEAIACLGLDPRRVEVVHNGSEFHANEPAPTEAPPADAVPAEFFLFVGSLEPGKNLALLREVYARTEAENRALPPLVIVGARWQGVKHEGPPPAGWHYMGRLPDAALVYLYRRAIGLVFPSRYEGFGLPVIEAMSLGCPVICSKVASLPEVGGDAPAYAKLDAAAYAIQMRRMTEDASWRRGCVERGLARAQAFSWDRCAAETARLYEAVGGG